MATNNGKGTTPISTLRNHGKEVKSATTGVVLAWLSVYKTFQRDGWSDLRAFSQEFVKANNGRDTGIWTVDTVRVTLGHIKWAEENLHGGARSCPSINHIIASKGGKKKVSEPVRPAGTITISAQDARKRLRASADIPNALVDDIVKALGLR